MTRNRTLLLCILVLALLLVACVDNWDGMDRSDWGWSAEPTATPVLSAGGGAW